MIMNRDVIYIVLIILLGYIFFIIDSYLRDKFLKQVLSIGTGKLFFFALFAPKRYFKEDKLLKGYIIYLINVFIGSLLIYLLIKVGGSVIR